MKTTTNQRLAWRFVALALASLAAGCSGQNGNPTTSGPSGGTGANSNVTCSRGVSSANGCVNKTQCSEESDCVGGYHCTGGTCQANKTCTSNNDCGGGTCETVLGKKLCVNPATCDPDLSGAGFLCSPGFYCTGGRECKPVTASTGDCSVGGRGCDHGVCKEDGTCGNPQFCSGNSDCLDEYICNSSSKCVSKEEDSACEGRCRTAQNHEGGVCNRYTGECVNATDPSCSKGNSCECADAYKGDSKDCFLQDLSNSNAAQLSSLCKRGYHWGSRGCEEDRCEDKSNCLSSVGGGVCDPNDHVCVEKTPCRDSGECIPKGSASGERICVSINGSTTGRCQQRADVCQQCELDGKTCKVVKKLGAPSEVVCVDEANKCKRSADCVGEDEGKICGIDGVCKAISQADKDACTASASTDNTDELHPSTAISSLSTGASSAEQTVCGAGPFYYKLSDTSVSAKKLRVTLTLKDADVGNVTEIVPSVTMGGTPATSTKESSPEGSWSYLFDTTNATSGNAVLLKLEFTGKGERLQTGAHFTIRLDYIDPEAEGSCSHSTAITFDSKGHWEGSGRLTNRAATEKDPVGLACSGKTSTASDIYTFTLDSTKHVVIELADKLGGTAPMLIVRRGCAYQDFAGSKCLETATSGGGTTYKDVLPAGEYTVIVAGATEGDYSLSVDSNNLDCTPKSNYCIPSSGYTKLSYCDVENNLSGQIKECKAGCDPSINACIEDYGRTCLSGHPIVFDANASGRRVVHVNLSDYRTAEKFTLSDSSSCLGNKASEKTGGANAFFHVTVPPHQILNVSKRKNPFGDKGWMGRASLALYALEGCGISAQCLSGKSLEKGNDGELTYANNTSESKEITVVLDTPDNTANSLNHQHNAYDTELEFTLTSYGECSKAAEARCYNNREVQVCQANGVWETAVTCSPLVGCTQSTPSGGGLTTAACKTLSNEVCGGALDITNTAINASFRYVQTTSPRSMATGSGAVACGRLSHTDDTGEVTGVEPLGRVLFYKVSTSSLGSGKKGKAVVRLTPEDGAKSFMRLWRVKGDEESTSCSSDSNISCEEGLGQKDFAYVANDSKRSLMLEFDVEANKEYRVAVEQAHGESGDQPFKIESKVVEDSGSDICDPQKTAVSCDSSAGKVSYCSKGGVKLDIECACGANGSVFCDKFAGASAGIDLDSTCATPVVLRAQSDADSEMSDTAVTQNNLPYVGTAGGAAPRRVFNQFEPTVGKHGSCYFGEKTIGYEQVFAVYLKEGDVLSASVAASKSGNPVPSETKFADATRLYLLKECGNLDSCEGLGTSNNSLSYKKTDSDGYVYLVVDNISTDFNYAGIGKLTWNVTPSASSKKCEAGKLYCKNDTTIAMCNSAGTGPDSSVGETACGTLKCIDGEAKCGFESQPSSNTCDLIADLGKMEPGKEKVVYYDPEKVPEAGSSFNDGGLNPVPTKAMAVKVKVSGADKAIKVVGRSLAGGVTPVAYVTGKEDSTCKTGSTAVAKSGDVVKKGSRDYETEFYYKPSAVDDYIVVVLTTKEADASVPLTFTISEVDATCTPGEYSCADSTGKPSVVSLCGSDYKLVEDYECPSGVMCDSTGGKKCSEEAVELFQAVTVSGKQTFTNPSETTKVSRSVVMPKTQSLYSGSVSCGTASLAAMPGSDVAYKVTVPAKKTLTVTAIDANSTDTDKKPLTLILAGSNDPNTLDCKSHASTTASSNTPAVLTYTSTDTNPTELYVIVDSANADLSGKTVNLTFSVTGSVDLTTATSPVTDTLKIPTQSNYGSAGFTCTAASSAAVPAMPGGDFLYKVKVPAGKTLTVTALDSDATAADKKAVALTVVKDLSDLSGSCVAYATSTAATATPASVTYTAGSAAVEEVYVIVDSASADLNGKMVSLSFSSN